MSTEEKVCVQVLGAMIGYATEQLAIIDEEFKGKLKGISEVIQWKIGDDIAYYTEIKDQTIKASDGTASNPTITFEVPDVSDALALFTQRGDTDITKIISAGKLKINGDAATVQKLGFILETVGEYMQGMGGD